MRVSSLVDVVLQRRPPRRLRLVSKWCGGQAAVSVPAETQILTMAFPLVFPSNRSRVFTTQEGNLCRKLARAHPKESKDHTDSGASISRLQEAQKPKQNAVTALERHVECDLTS